MPRTWVMGSKIGGVAIFIKGQLGFSTMAVSQIIFLEIDSKFIDSKDQTDYNLHSHSDVYVWVISSKWYQVAWNRV